MIVVKFDVIYLFIYLSLCVVIDCFCHYNLSYIIYLSPKLINVPFDHSIVFGPLTLYLYLQMFALLSICQMLRCQ